MNPVVLLVINRMVDIQLLADPGTHSAHCAADRGLSQVQFLVWLSCPCCCATTGALVRRAENCRVSAVAVCARWCNDWECAMLGSTVDTCSASPGWLMEEFVRFST